MVGSLVTRHVLRFQIPGVELRSHMKASVAAAFLATKRQVELCSLDQRSHSVVSIGMNKVGTIMCRHLDIIGKFKVQHVTKLADSLRREAETSTVPITLQTGFS